MHGLRAWRSVLVIGGLMAFLALVAIAAAGHAPSAGADRPSAPAPTLLQDYVLTLALLIMPLGLGLVIWALVLSRIYKGVSSRKSNAPARVPVIVLIAIIVVLLVLILRFADPSKAPTLGVPLGGGATSTGATAPPPKDPYEPQFRWLPVVVVGGLIVGIGGAMLVMALRRQRELLAATPLRETVADVLTETLDDLRREADPRKAVIAAYAKMERTLAARGIPRRESEAPVEYLARILDVVSASGHSVRRLTALFARARFSPHEVDATMKEDAIEALTGLRAELQAP